MTLLSEFKADMIQHMTEVEKARILTALMYSDLSNITVSIFNQYLHTCVQSLTEIKTDWDKAAQLSGSTTAHSCRVQLSKSKKRLLALVETSKEGIDGSAVPVTPKKRGVGAAAQSSDGATETPSKSSSKSKKSNANQDGGDTRAPPTKKPKQEPAAVKSEPEGEVSLPRFEDFDDDIVRS